MTQFRSALLIILLFVAVPNTQAVILGYITGNDYFKLDDNAKLGWLVGVMDGIMADSTTVERSEKGPWLGRCIDGLDTRQIKAMFEKELNQNPEGWHAPAALIFIGKMRDFCKGRI